MNKEDIENLVNTDFEKMQIIVNRIFKEEYVRKLEQENNQLKEQRQELRRWLEEQYQEYKETEDERGIVLTSYAIDKLNELEGGKND